MDVPCFFGAPTVIQRHAVGGDGLAQFAAEIVTVEGPCEVRGHGLGPRTGTPVKSMPARLGSQRPRASPILLGLLLGQMKPWRRSPKRARVRSGHRPRTPSASRHQPGETWPPCPWLASRPSGSTKRADSKTMHVTSSAPRPSPARSARLCRGIRAACYLVSPSGGRTVRVIACSGQATTHSPHAWQSSARGVYAVSRRWAPTRSLAKRPSSA